MGHSRSTALAETRYDKERKLQTLKDAIEQVRYELPEIAVFFVDEGLAAVMEPLRLKKSHARKG
jgi:hypothetical protein